MIGNYDQLDADVRRRIDSACDFLNHKIAEQRRKVLLAAAWAGVAGIALAALLRMPPWPLLAVGVMAVVLLFAARAHREIRRWFKSLVVKRVVEALGNQLTYAEASSFTRAHFLAMDVFADRTDVFRSEDEVNGRHNDVAFSLHEVKAAKREKRGKNTHTIVFFKGTIVVIEFNKHFYGHTTVVPQAAYTAFGGLLGEGDSRRDRQRVSMHDAEFEEVYSVFATNDQQAHYLLTPKLLQLIMEARRVLGAQLRLSFHDNMVHVAVPSTHDRFEAGLFSGRVTAAQVIGDLGSAVHLAQNLIETLELETRIWTRV